MESNIFLAGYLNGVMLIIVLVLCSHFSSAQVKVTTHLKTLYSRVGDSGDSEFSWFVYLGGQQKFGKRDFETPATKTVNTEVVEETTATRINWRFKIWENDCGARDKYESSCGFLGMEGDDDRWDTNYQSINLLDYDPGVTYAFTRAYREYIFPVGTRDVYRIEYTLEWEMARSFTIEKSPNGGTGYCLGEDPILLWTQSHGLDSDFNARYEWTIAHVPTGQVIVINDDATLNISNDISLVNELRSRKLLSEPLQVHVAIKSGNKILSESSPVIIHVHDTPPEIVVDNIDLITLENEGQYSNANISIRNILCQGASTGKITIKNVSSGNGLYHYYLSGGGQLYTVSAIRDGDSIVFPDDTNTSIGLKSTAYTLGIENVKSANNQNAGCYRKYPITLLEPQPLGASIYQKEYLGGFNVSCFGAIDGEISVRGIGGMPPYTYQLWANDSLMYQVEDQRGNFVFTGLSAVDDVGSYIDYKVYIVDAFGCLYTTNKDDVGNSLRLTYPDPLQFSFIDITSVNCFGANNGSVQFDLVGGVLPYQLTLEGIEEQSMTVWDEEQVPQFNSLVAGSFVIKCKDANGCLDEEHFSIEEPNPIVIDESELSDARCYGANDASYSVKAGGGLPGTPNTYTYFLQHNSPPETLPFSFEQEHVVTGQEARFDNLIAGEYTLRIQDSVACTASYPITIQSPEIMQAILDTDSLICAWDSTGTAKAYMQGGTSPYILEWKNERGETLKMDSVAALSESRLINLPGGMYFLSAIDSKGCFFHPEGLGFLIPYPDSLQIVIDALALNKDDCNDVAPGVVTLSASGGWRNLGNYKYTHDGKNFQEDNFFDNLASGFYTFSVLDPRGCKVNIPATIPEGGELQVFIEDVKNVSCSGATDGYCVFRVIGGMPPYDISIDGGISWHRDKTFFHSLPPADYHVKVKDAGHCIYELVIPILAPDPMIVGVEDFSNAECGASTGFVSVSVDGGNSPYQVAWWHNRRQLPNETSVVLKNISSGAVEARVTDANGCVQTITWDVSDKNHPTVDTIMSRSVSCFGKSDGKIEIGMVTAYSSDPGYQLIYDFDTIHSHIIDNQPAGSHQLFIIDSNGCMLSKKVLVDSPSSISLKIDDQVSPSCHGYCDGMAIVKAHGGVGVYTYQWEPKALARDSVIVNACGGSYQVIVQDKNQCQVVHEVVFENPDPIALMIPDSITICPGSDVTINTGLTGEHYWHSDTGFESQDQEVTLTKAGVYSIEIRTPEGCKDKDSLVLMVSNAYLKADFLISNTAQAGDTLVAIEISNPIPTDVYWKVPDDVYHETVGILEEFVFSKTGTYLIALIAELEGCIDTLVQEVLVYDSLDSFEPEMNASVLIESVRLFPNPNGGEFEIAIVLYKERPIIITVIDASTTSVIWQTQQEGSDTYLEKINLPGLTPGVYLLSIKVESQIKILRFVVQ